MKTESVKMAVMLRLADRLHHDYHQTCGNKIPAMLVGAQSAIVFAKGRPGSFNTFEKKVLPFVRFAETRAKRKGIPEPKHVVEFKELVSELRNRKVEFNLIDYHTTGVTDAETVGEK